MKTLKTVGDGTAKAAAKFLLDSGLLFEINRLVLHPVGMALSIACDDDTEEIEGFANLWDYRDDEEGVLFDPSTFVVGTSKFMVFRAELEGHAVSKREETLGYRVQTSLKGASDTDNKGLPCPACGQKMKRLDIKHIADMVHVRINDALSQKDLKGLVAILKQFITRGK